MPSNLELLSQLRRT